MFPPILSIFATIFCTEFEINEIRLRDWTIFNCYPPQTRTLWQPKSSNYLPCLLSMIRMINNEVWSPSIRSNRSVEINEIAICSVLRGVLANRTNSCDRGTHPRFCGRITRWRFFALSKQLPFKYQFNIYKTKKWTLSLFPDGSRRLTMLQRMVIKLI